MDSKQRTEIFINVHKGLRRGLWGMALRIGELDFGDGAEVESAGRELENLIRFLREHAANEDEVQFPFLEVRAPGATRQGQEEHRELESRLDLLEKHWYQLLREKEREEPGYRFYLEYNQFVSRYLDHMDGEERELTEAFYRHCSDPEIEQAFKKIVERTSPQAMDVILSYMIPAMNPSERVEFMAKTEAAATPEVFGKVKGLAKDVLSPESWASYPRAWVSQAEKTQSSAGLARLRAACYNDHAMSEPTEPTNPPPAQAGSPRKRAKKVLLGLLAAAAVTGTAVWLLTMDRESTDDAVVEAHVLSVSARTPGQVERLLVTDNQVVEAGQVLVELDARELKARLDLARADEQSAQAQLDLAKAQLEVTERSTTAGVRQARGSVSQAASTVDSSKAQVDQAKADLAAAEARFRLTSLELERARSLLDSKAIPQAEFDMRQANQDQAKAAREQAEARLQNMKAAITGGYAGVEQARGRLAAAETAPQQVKAARAQVELAAAHHSQTQAALRLAELNLSYATIRAPRRASVARRSVEVGNMVSPDRPLLALVALDDVWVVANFKETQIGKMRPGQRATVTVDAYGGRKISAHVESVAAGTGSRFALLPPDNASGNFIKVVQRIPVLLRIDDFQGLELRPGMSADVTVLLQ